MTPSRTATVWLAIDDADTGNACMRFIPGSHRHGHLTYHLSEADENNVLFQTVRDAENYGDPIDVELKAGEISIHSDLLLHSSHYNESDRRRCGLTLRYVAPHVSQPEINSLGGKYPTILIRGEDRYHNFPEQPRPFPLAS